MKNKILNILKTNGGYISGEEISRQLKISRSMVWKYINKLREDGYIISSVTNKGYSLENSPKYDDKIDIDYIIKNLKTEFIGRNIIYKNVSGSTNSDAKNNSEMADGSLFIAEKQNAGRGRRGKGWVSEAGEGIYMTILLKPEISPEKISCLTLAAGMAVCKALRGFDVDASIKWPNDIIADSKKICGILVELSAEDNEINYAVCGIGINVHQKSFPDNISGMTSSVLLSTNKEFSRNDIIISVMNCFEKYYKKFLSCGMSALIDEYKGMCITIGREVTIIKADKKFTATAVGLEENGGLIINHNGISETVTSGEVSVRGLLGYV